MKIDHSLPGRVIHWLASPRLLFWLLPVMMIWLIAGTVAQAQMSLHDALETYFKGWLIWIDTPFIAIPFPGAYPIMGLFTLSLCARFIAKTDWRLEKLGLNLAHFGVLLLLIGGFITAQLAKEGYMLIPEGQRLGFVSDYHKRVLVVFRGNEAVAEFEKSEILTADQIADPLPGLPFDVIPLSGCRNCEIVERNAADAATAFQIMPENNARAEAKKQAQAMVKDNPKRSMARFMALEAGAPEMEDEANIGGLTLLIRNAEYGTGTPEEGERQNGVYIAFEGMPEPIEIRHQGRLYHILLGKAQRPLPFRLELTDFEKTIYPGLDMASGYASDLVIHDGDLRWPVRVEMNQPLRYRGYTFYQSAFEEDEAGRQATILAVVENKGRLFPYIATAVIAFGLLLHIILMRGRSVRRKKEEGS